MEIKESEVEASPTIGTKYKMDFIQGMYQKNEGFVMLLNIDMIFNNEDIILNNEIVASSIGEDVDNESL